MWTILGLILAGSLLTEASSTWSPETAGRPRQDRIYAVRGPEVLSYATSAEARANAANVVEVAIDHVGVPRGLTGGYCHVTGRVVRVVRGAGPTPQGRIEISAPCVAQPRPGESRRIPEGEFAKGSSSLFYFSAGQELLDVERIRE